MTDREREHLIKVLKQWQAENNPGEECSHGMWDAVFDLLIELEETLELGGSHNNEID